MAIGHAEIRLNEFMAATSESLEGLQGEPQEWIELHNTGDAAVPLEGYILTDSDDVSLEDASTFWPFPAVSIEPGGYLLVLASGEGADVEAGFLQANFRLSREGERLALVIPDGITVVDELAPSFPPQQAEVTYGVDPQGDWKFLTEATPGAANTGGIDGFVSDVSFSVQRGFYEEPFSVELSTATEGAQIVYTTDGREPSLGTIFTGVIGTTYEGPIEINKTTVLRAIAFQKDKEASVHRAQTYIFLDDVLHQPKEPEGFPSKWGSRTPDYEMDPDIVGGTYPEDEVKQALLSLPTISLVTDNDNLFASDGIYTNSLAKDNENDGIEDKWERPVSVEMLGFPHGETVQANAGIRIQGNASRNPNRVKHNMRLVFRSHYGPSKLRFRLFEDSEVNTFNSINLRSNNGDSWINPGVRVRAQYIRDQWHRVVQREMRQPNQSQIYAHIYINGLYWGLYHVFERFEASLLTEHWGGNTEDWDALQDTPAFQDIVVNGDEEAYRLTHDLVKKDLTIPANYEKALEYVDVDNLIDYLLLNFYSSNEDWDHKNMRYARRRTPAEDGFGSGWLFFAWDSERAGLNGLQNQSLTMDNTGKRTNLGPTFLNAELHDNPDYHLRFSDRLVKHCFNGGALTPEGVSKSWNDLAQSIYQGLIGESARWGDLHVGTPEVREGNWQKALDKENNVWIPARTEVLLGQLAKRGFSEKKPSFPQFEPFGGVVAAGTEIPIKIFNDTIFNPVVGDVYYTMDGTDPRQADGSLDPDAIPYDPANKPIIHQSLTMMGRVYDAKDGDWSPLSEAYFHLAELPSSKTLTIREIQYRSNDLAESEVAGNYRNSDFEFIQLENLGDVALDLSSLQITNGIRATVDPALKPVIPAGDHAYIVANREAFQAHHPDISANQIIATFDQGSRLANGGERLTIRDHTGLLIHSLRYDNRSPWPSDTGRIAFQGSAETSIADPTAWIASDADGGQAEPGPATTLAAWLESQGLTSAEESLGTSGHPALLFYALGIDDWAQDVSLQVHGDSLQYQRRKSVADMDWFLESSQDLITWKSLVPTGTSTQSISASAEIVTAPIPTSNQSATYWRLRVQTK